MAATFPGLLAKVKAYQPNLDEHWLEGVYTFAKAAHGGQTRASGDRYISHPLAVATILAEFELDPPTIAASLFHDVCVSVHRVYLGTRLREPSATRRWPTLPVSLSRWSSASLS